MSIKYSTQELLDADGNIVRDKHAKHASDGMLLVTAFLGILIGFILMYLAKRGNVMWMMAWGFGLILVSLFLGCVTYFEWELTWLKSWFKAG